MMFEHASRRRNSNADPDAVAHQINAVVAGATNNRIQHLIADGAIDPLTVLALVNALYLMASWISTFDAAATRPPFTGSGGAKMTMPMMNGTGDSSAAGNGRVGATKNYTGGLSAQFILPDEGRFDEIATDLEPGLCRIHDQADERVFIVCHELHELIRSSYGWQPSEACSVSHRCVAAAVASPVRSVESVQADATDRCGWRRSERRPVGATPTATTRRRPLATMVPTAVLDRSSTIVPAVVDAVQLGGSCPTSVICDVRAHAWPMQRGRGVTSVERARASIESHHRLLLETCAASAERVRNSVVLDRAVG